MRAYLSPYQWKTPQSLDEALNWMAKEPGRWRPFAGGTDLMVLFEAGKLKHHEFFDLMVLKELQKIEISEEGVWIGAGVTYHELQAHPEIQKHFPLLISASKEVGALAIQNRGTLGGNIVNASPAADSPPALLVYDAKVELESIEGKRVVWYREFHLDYKKMVLNDHELLTRIFLPFPKKVTFEQYRKVGTRKAQAISKICFCGRIEWDGKKVLDIRLAYGAVAPIPLRVVQTEKHLLGSSLSDSEIASVCLTLQKEISPIDDLRSDREYRRSVSENLLKDFLKRTKSEAF